MKLVVAIAFGGALGAVARYSCQSAVHQWLGRSFPYGTLVVNVLGSFFMGVLFAWFSQRTSVNDELRAALLVGLLGAFTTFSTFSFETVLLLQAGAYWRAVGNMVLSVLLCVGFCWLGLVIGGVLKS